MPTSPARASSVWTEVPGALLAIAISGLLILGLWAVARNAPSAGTDPRLAPTATVVVDRGPFGDQVFVTVVPQPALPGTVVTGAGGV